MNREILFKAKRKNNGEWVEGGYYSEPYTEIQFIICWNSYGFGFNECVEIDPDTICQYTGLTDKNDNKIWENDIVKTDGCSLDCDNGIGKIIFYEGIWYIDGSVQNSLYDLYRDGEIEVIGNIFDNPGLLEVE